MESEVREQIMFLSDERLTLETLDFTIRMVSTPTFLYFNLIDKTLVSVNVIEIDTHYIYWIYCNILI